MPTDCRDGRSGLGKPWLPAPALEEGKQRHLSELMTGLGCILHRAQWPAAPRGKALPLASPGATMVPPPTHGLAQPVPKWLDFLLHPHLLLSPGSQGGHWQRCPSILKSHRLPPIPSPHTSEPGFPSGGGKKGASSCSRYPCPWVSSDPQLLSLSCAPGFTLPAITGLWVWDVVFAAGLGWSRMGRRLGY